MHYPVTRRCFVVTGNSWAQIFSLVIGMDPDIRMPIWRRLHVLVDRGTDLLRGARAGIDAGCDLPPANAAPADRAPRPVPGIQIAAGAHASDEDEPTQDTQEVRWARFASGVIHATGIAVRNTRATELVLVAPPPMLVLLRQRVGALLRSDVALAEVPMNLELLVAGTGRGQIAAEMTPLPMFA